MILAFGMRVRGVLAVPPGSGRSSILGRLREEFRAGARAPGFVFRHGLIRGSTGLYPRSAPGRGSKLIPVEKTKWVLSSGWVGPLGRTASPSVKAIPPSSFSAGFFWVLLGTVLGFFSGVHLFTALHFTQGSTAPTAYLNFPIDSPL